MKIAIYGVSRSGKNYLIEKLLKSLKEKAYHLEGSTTLNEMSFARYERRFKELTEDEKDLLRKKFTKLIEEKEKEYDVVFVDGHYAFINNSGYSVVFTDEDKYAYDAFFYLDTPSDMVVQFSRNSIGEKQNIDITEEDVHNWKNFEKEEMSPICKTLGKELIVIGEDANIERSIKVVRAHISKYIVEKLERENLSSLKRKIDEILLKSNCGRTILLDADGTLIPYDSAEVMAKHLSCIDVSDLKPIFKKYADYCFPAFYDVAQYYSENNSKEDFIRASKNAAEEIEIRDEFIQLFNEIDADFIIVTAGFSLLWKNIIEKYNLRNVNLIAGNTVYDDCIIGQNEKGIVVDTLKESGKSVICFGDALVDKDMFLKSDSGYLLVDSRKKSIIPHIENNSKFEYVSFGDITIESMKQTNFKSIIQKLKTVERVGGLA